MACSLYLFKGLVGCVGGLFLHLLVGAIYLWGIINVYVTSYYTLIEREQSLTTNAIVFPCMLLCLGFGMKVGNMTAAKIGLPVMTLILSIVLSGLTLACSYVEQFAVFVVLFAVLFGFGGGMCFTSALVQNNKYFVDKQPYVNGFILIGTGLGTAVFGPFCYQYLNPHYLSPVNGLYVTPDLQEIAYKVPSLFRWLALFELCLGLVGTILVTPVYLENRRKQKSLQEILPTNVVNQSSIELQPMGENPQDPNNNDKSNQQEKRKYTEKTESTQNLQNDQVVVQVVPAVLPSQDIVNQHEPQPPKILLECPSLYTAFTHKSTYFLCFTFFTIVIGNLFVNSNYKTYVKGVISNDKLLTLMGAFASLSNGLTRFPSNVIHRLVGLKVIVTAVGIINIIVYSTIHLAIFHEGVYFFLVILCNIMLGMIFGSAPTQCYKTFGPKVGADIYGFYWTWFSMASFTSYGLATKVNFHFLFYIFAGINALSIASIWFIQLQIDWSDKVKEVEITPPQDVPRISN